MTLNMKRRPGAGAKTAIRRGVSLLAAAMAAFGLAAPAQAMDEVRVAQDAAGRCDGLAQTKVPASAFDLPTGGAAIQQAMLVAADSATGLPEYCRVRGAISAAQGDAPPILFQINLPTRWNLKTVHFGGAGTNGVLVEATGDFTGGGGPVVPALARGFVTYGSDSGHQGPGREFYENAQAFANYAHEAVKRSKDLTRAIVRAYYGADARRDYHVGGSKGGQEGLQAAQRYFADFDGVVAYYPAAQNQSLQIGWNRLWHFAFDPPGGALGVAEQALLKSAVLARCDGLDGAADGIVSNTRACGEAFDVTTLRCPDGQDAGDGCLSDIQITALRVAAAPFRFAHPMPNGVQTIGPWPVFIGGELPLWFGDGTNGSQQAFYRWPAARPEALSSSGIDAETWRRTVEPVARVYDASNPDLDGFKARGGKLILLQGDTDMLVPGPMTTAYFEALSGRYGSGLGDFARYYVVPGYGHGRGDFTVQWDSLAALDAWVEAGKPPERPIATDGTAQTRGRTRPICEYPAWPKYAGKGPLDQAESFTCAFE